MKRNFLNLSFGLLEGILQRRTEHKCEASIANTHTHTHTHMHTKTHHTHIHTHVCKRMHIHTHTHTPWQCTSLHRASRNEGSETQISCAYLCSPLGQLVHLYCRVCTWQETWQGRNRGKGSEGGSRRGSGRSNGRGSGRRSLA